MANYFMSLTDDGSGNFTPTAIRGGVAPSGGTAITIPGYIGMGSAGSVTATKLIGDAIYAIKRAVQNDLSVNGL